jgi:hypothetical protein
MNHLSLERDLQQEMVRLQTIFKSNNDSIVAIMEAMTMVANTVLNALASACVSVFI